MGTYRRTIVLGLDYSNFSGGLTECNRKMGLLDAEFKRATEEAKLYGTETDQLRLKHDWLTQKIELQKQKVEEHKKALERVSAANHEGSAAVDSARRSLIQQEGALLSLQHQLQETDNEYDNLAESADTFGDSIRGVADMLGLEASPALEAFASKFDGVNKDVGEAIIIIGGLASAYAGLSIELAQTADGLLTLSVTSGIATDTLQELQYASEFVDVSVETMNGSMTKLIRAMSSAKDGNEELRKTFSQLGVAYKDGSGELKNVEDVFYDVIDALGEMSNETERDAKSMEIFGKSARELNPLIEAGSARLKELGEEAHKVGYVLDEETLQSAGQLDDAMQRFNRTVEAVKNQLGIHFVPALTAVTELLADIPGPVWAGIAVFGSLVMVIGSVTKAVIALRTANAIAAMSNMMLASTGAAATVGMGPLLFILLGIAAAIALIVGGTVAVSKAMNEVKSSAEGVVNRASEKTKSIKTNYYAKGTDSSDEGYAWVGEHGPERIYLPQGSQVLSANKSKRLGDTTNIYNITIDSKNVDEFNRIVKLAQAEQVSYRVGRVRT